MSATEPGDRLIAALTAQREAMVQDIYQGLSREIPGDAQLAAKPLLEPMLSRSRDRRVPTARRPGRG
ncbi:MAG TPA: hypothetical protein VFM49_15880 [Chloroflexia bacterium]|jgi:hypothetical protein|nr:hypothetical protein [Chloroflexia bacterium]